jgi:Circularly permutated YpsA SLOG family
MIEKIISGGQTGADRAALDWAIKQGIAGMTDCRWQKWLALSAINQRARSARRSVGAWAKHPVHSRVVTAYPLRHARPRDSSVRG